MRLKPNEVEAIKSAAVEAFGPAVVVRLFGSRVHDQLKGGDIDLLIEVDPGQDTIRHEAHFLDAVFEKIDERKVDLLFKVRGREPSAFVRHVAPQSVPLS